MELLSPDFEDTLQTKIIGRPLYIYSQLDSTQTTAKHLAENGAKEGTTVLAYSQKKGIGRNGRKWFSPKGGIWFTVILRPHFSSEKANMINISFTTACAEVFYSFGIIQPVIKWPNDILANGKKICGILTQMKSTPPHQNFWCGGKPKENKNNPKNKSDIEYALVGIGINLTTEIEDFPPALKNKATSLKQEIGENIKADDFLTSLLGKIEKNYLMLKKGESTKILKKWQEFSLPFGLLVKTSTSKGIYQGQLVGTNEHGHLIIRSPHGKLEEVAAGEIELIG
jgi:BirA family biotin operon repressor/biotin-[acetyl-CoA-carboxylase] ligase